MRVPTPCRKHCWQYASCQLPGYVFWLGSNEAALQLALHQAGGKDPVLPVILLYTHLRRRPYKFIVARNKYCSAGQAQSAGKHN